MWSDELNACSNSLSPKFIITPDPLGKKVDALPFGFAAPFANTTSDESNNRRFWNFLVDIIDIFIYL
jgi:hypothetical protein